MFECASSGDLLAGTTLCLVCRAARTWVLPNLYTRVTLTSSSEIVRFAYAIMEDPSISFALLPTPTSCIRALWLGHTSSTTPNDLKYDSSAWPITLIHQILARCTALRALAIAQLGQRRWYRLSGVVPASVTALFLGPVHGALDVRHLPCALSLCLREFTSLDTFMVDTEICALVRAPGVRVVRRVYTSEAHVGLAFEQLACVDARAAALEKMEIVCYGETREDATLALEEMAGTHEYDRDRVVLVPRAQILGNDGLVDGVRTLYREWLAYKDI